MLELLWQLKKSIAARVLLLYYSMKYFRHQLKLRELINEDHTAVWEHQGWSLRDEWCIWAWQLTRNCRNWLRDSPWSPREIASSIFSVRSVSEGIVKKRSPKKKWRFQVLCPILLEGRRESRRPQVHQILQSGTETSKLTESSQWEGYMVWKLWTFEWFEWGCGWHRCFIRVKARRWKYRYSAIPVNLKEKTFDSKILQKSISFSSSVAI